MSINSYCHYEVAWPSETPIVEGFLYGNEPEDLGKVLRVEREVYDSYSEHVLDEIIDMFGRSLDEVPGLELHLIYSCEEDEYFECHLDILGGEVTYEESKIVFVQRPLDQGCICIGR